MSSMSEYENSAALDHSFHRHNAPSPPKKTPERISHIPIRHHQLHRSKRLDEPPSALDSPTDKSPPKSHDKSPMLDSGLGELAKSSRTEERESSNN